VFIDDGSLAWQYIFGRQADRPSWQNKNNPVFESSWICVSSTKIMLSLSFHLVKAIRKGWCEVG